MLSLAKSETPEFYSVSKANISMHTGGFAVVDRWQNMIYRTALTMTRSHEDAEDILQEVFFKYFRLEPAFTSIEHEKAWFLRVTINECKNLLRSVWHSRRADVNLEHLSIPESTPKNSKVLETVLSLPQKYRIVTYLYYYEDYSVKEIAEITLQAPNTVAQQLVRSRKKLRKKLEQEELL